MCAVSFFDLHHNHGGGRLFARTLQRHILSAVVVQVKSLEHPLRVFSVEITKVVSDQFNASRLYDWGLPCKAASLCLDGSEGDEIILLHIEELGLSRLPVELVELNKRSFNWRVSGSPHSEVEVQAGGSVNLIECQQVPAVRS